MHVVERNGYLIEGMFLSSIKSRIDIEPRKIL